MSGLPSQKMLRRFFWAIGLIMSLTASIWFSLVFILQMEELNEYSVVHNAWYGVYLASKFVTISLLFIMGIIFIMRIIVAILDEIYDPEEEPEPPKNHKPKPGDPDWQIDLGDLSDFD